MLFKLIVDRVNTSYSTIFKIKKIESLTKEYLVSAENKQKLAEHYNRLPKEGIATWVNVFGSKNRPWTEERTWKEVEGDDHDAHFLLLESPTGVTYTKQLKYI